MRTYLVTGGAGFIGSNYIHYMFKKYGDEIRIINVDALTYAGNLENLKGVEDRPNYTFVRADICDKETIAKMEAAENARRLSAAEAKATETLSAFNANREDKVDVKVLEALMHDIKDGKYTACADENGVWTGDKLIEREVKALCADAVMEFDKAAAAKRVEPKQMTWGSVKQASANPGTIGELFASKN